MTQETDKVPFDEAIKRHKKMGIQTYTMETGCKKLCLLKQPSMEITGKIMPLLITIEGQQKADYGKAAIIIMDECWIAGDDEIRKDEELKFEVGLAALNLVKMKLATVKKN